MNTRQAPQIKDEESRRSTSPGTVSEWERLYRQYFTPPAEHCGPLPFKKLSVYNESCPTYVSDSTNA